MLTDERLAEIRDRWGNATSGPWRWKDATGLDDTGEYLYGGSDTLVVGTWGHDWRGLEITDADAEAIAHAPEDVAELLAEVQLLREALSNQMLKHAITGLGVYAGAWLIGNLINPDLQQPGQGTE